MEAKVMLVLPGESPKQVTANLSASLEKMKADIVAARPELGSADEYDLLVLPRISNTPLQNYKPGPNDTLYLVKKLSLQGPSIKGI